MFKTDCLMELTPTKAPPTRLPPPLHPGTKLPKINTVKVRENVINVSRDRARKLGQDVTIEAQDIFDALSKTYATCFRSTFRCAHWVPRFPPNREAK